MLTMPLAAMLLLPTTLQPAQAGARAAPAPAPASAPRFTLATGIERIAADPKGRAVLDAGVPGLTSHRAYGLFKRLSLRQLQPRSNGRLTAEQLAKVQADLASLG